MIEQLKLFRLLVTNKHLDAGRKALSKAAFKVPCSTSMKIIKYIAPVPKVVKVQKVQAPKVKTEVKEAIKPVKEEAAEALA